MRATVSCQFRGSVKTRSAASHRHMWLSERFAADVAEASEHEAPVAVEWQVSPWTEAPNPRHTRFFVGSHYRQVVDGDTVDARELLKRLGSDDFNIVPFANGYITSRFVGGIDPADTRITEIRETDREDAMADAMELVGDLLVVGEALYLRCPEPCLTLVNDHLLVTTTVPGDPGRGNVPRPFVESIEGSGHWNRFSLIETDAALAAQAVFAGRELGLPAYTVRCPESVSSGPTVAALHEAVRMTLDLGGGKTPLGDVHPAFLKAATPLAELCWSRNLAAIDGDLLCEAIDTALRGATRAEMQIGQAEDRIRLAMQRWENRPVTPAAGLGGLRP